MSNCNCDDEWKRMNDIHQLDCPANVLPYVSDQTVADAAAAMVKAVDVAPGTTRRVVVNTADGKYKVEVHRYVVPKPRAHARVIREPHEMTAEQARMARAALGLSRAAAALRAKMTAATIYRIEHDVSGPQQRSREKLQKAYEQAGCVFFREGDHSGVLPPREG